MIKAKELYKIQQEALAQELKYCQEVVWPKVTPKLQEKVLAAAERGKTSIDYIVTNPDAERIHDIFNWYNCLNKNLKKLGYHVCERPMLSYTYSEKLLITISWKKVDKKK